MNARFAPLYADSALALDGENEWLCGWLVVDGRVPCTICHREVEKADLLCSAGRIICPACQ